MTAGSVNHPGEQPFHVYIVYNRARSRFSITDDTQLSQRFALRIAELLQNQGISVYSPERDSEQSEIEQLIQQLNTTTWAVIVLTPEFLRQSWNTYKTIPALQRRINDDSLKEKTACLAIGLTTADIPNELSTLNTISFNKNFEDDVENWTKFKRYFSTPGIHRNETHKLPSTCPVKVVTAEKDSSVPDLQSTRSILDYKARGMELVTEKFLGSWYHPTVSHGSSPPMSPPNQQTKTHRNISIQSPSSSARESPQRSAFRTFRDAIDDPPSRFAHLYKPLSHSVRPGHPSRTEFSKDKKGQQTGDSNDSSDRNVECNRMADKKLKNTMAGLAKTNRERQEDSFLGNERERKHLYSQHSEKQVQTSDVMLDVTESTHLSLYKSKSYTDMIGLDDSYQCHDEESARNLSPSSLCTPDSTLMTRFGPHSSAGRTRKSTIESVFIRPRRGFSSSPKRTFAYTKYSIENSNKPTPSGYKNNRTTLTDGYKTTVNGTDLTNAVYPGVPSVQISDHSQDKTDQRPFQDFVDDSSDRKHVTSFLETEGNSITCRSKQESASRCPCNLKLEASLSHGYVDAQDTPKEAHGDRFRLSGNWLDAHNVSPQSDIENTFWHRSKRGHHHTYPKFDENDCSPLATYSCPENVSPKSEPHVKTFRPLSPIRPRGITHPTSDLPRASSPMCSNSSLPEDSFALGDPSGSYLQEDVQGTLLNSPVTNGHIKRTLDRCELYSSPVLQELNRSDLSEDLTYVHSRLEEHSKSLHDHSTRLQEILSKANRAIEARRSFNSSSSDANSSKGATETLPFEEDTYFRLPPLRSCNTTQTNCAANEIYVKTPLRDQQRIKGNSEAFAKGVHKLRQLTAKFVVDDPLKIIPEKSCTDSNTNYVFKPLSLDTTLTFSSKSQDSLSDVDYSRLKTDDSYMLTHQRTGLRSDPNYGANDSCAKPSVNRDSKYPAKHSSSGHQNFTAATGNKGSDSSKDHPELVQSVSNLHSTDGNIDGNILGTDRSEAVVYQNTQLGTGFQLDLISQYEDEVINSSDSPVILSTSYHSIITDSLDAPSNTDSGVFDRSLESINTNCTLGNATDARKDSRRSKPLCIRTCHELSAGDTFQKNNGSLTPDILLNNPAETNIKSNLKNDFNPENQYTTEPRFTTRVFSSGGKHNQDNGHELLDDSSSVRNLSQAYRNGVDNRHTINKGEPDVSKSCFKQSRLPNRGDYMSEEIPECKSNANVFFEGRLSADQTDESVSRQNYVEEETTTGRIVSVDLAKFWIQEYQCAKDCHQSENDRNCDRQSETPASKNINHVNTAPGAAQRCSICNDSLSRMSATGNCSSQNYEVQTCNNFEKSPDVGIKYCHNEEQQHDILPHDNVEQMPYTEVQTCDICSVGESPEAQTCNNVDQSLDNEAQICDEMEQSMDTDVQTCDNMKQSPDTVQACDNVGQSLDNNVQSYDMGQSRDSEMQTCDNVEQAPATEMQTCGNVGQSPATEMQTCDNVGQSPATEMQTCDNVEQAPASEMQTCDNVEQAPATEMQTCDNVEQSPATEMQTCGNMEQSPATEMQTWDNVEQSPATEMQTCDNVEQSPATEMQTLDNVEQSPATETQTCDNVEQSPATEMQTYDDVEQSRDTKLQTCDMELYQSVNEGLNLCETVGDMPDTGTSCFVESVSPSSGSEVLDRVITGHIPNTDNHPSDKKFDSTDNGMQSDDDVDHYFHNEFQLVPCDTDTKAASNNNIITDNESLVNICQSTWMNQLGTGITYQLFSETVNHPLEIPFIACPCNTGDTDRACDVRDKNCLQLLRADEQVLSGYQKPQPFENEYVTSYLVSSKSPGQKLTPKEWKSRATYPSNDCQLVHFGKHEQQTSHHADSQFPTPRQPNSEFSPPYPVDSDFKAFYQQVNECLSPNSMGRGYHTFPQLNSVYEASRLTDSEFREHQKEVMVQDSNLMIESVNGANSTRDYIETIEQKYLTCVALTESANAINLPLCTDNILDGKEQSANVIACECHSQNPDKAISSTHTSLVVAIDRPLPRDILTHRIILPSGRHHYFDYFRFFGRRPLYSMAVESQILRGSPSLLPLAYLHVSRDLDDGGTLHGPLRYPLERSTSEPCLLTSSSDGEDEERAVVPVHQIRPLHRRTLSNLEDYSYVVQGLPSRRISSRGTAGTLNTLYRMMCHVLSRPEQFYL